MTSRRAQVDMRTGACTAGERRPTCRCGSPAPPPIVLPPGDVPARLTWHQRPLTVGDVAPPPPGQCVVHGMSGPLPDPATTSAPREYFLEPGAHTIALDAPATVPALAGPGTIVSSARYALTFERVDGNG